MSGTSTTKFNPVFEQEMRDSWVNLQMVELDAKEDQFYASIGAYDPENWQGHLVSERARFVSIADHCISAEDPEDVMNYGRNWGCTESREYIAKIAAVVGQPILGPGLQEYLEMKEMEYEQAFEFADPMFNFEKSAGR